MWRVEREVARLDLGQADDPVHRAGELLGEDDRLSVDDLRLGDAVGDFQRGFQRLDDAHAVGVVFGRDPFVVTDHQPVDHHLDAVLAVFLQVEPGRLVDVEHIAIDTNADKALAANLVENTLVLALAVADDRRQDHQPRVARQLEQLTRHLLHRLRHDRPPALRAVRVTDAREKQPHVVVDLGDGADRRARVAAAPLLVDRDRRGEPVDVVDVRFLHLTEELPGIGGERLHVTALALGEDRVKRQRALARPGQPGQDDELVTRNVDIDILEIVLPGAAHADPVVKSHETEFLARGARNLRGFIRTNDRNMSV